MASRPWSSSAADRSTDGVESVEDVDEEDDGDGGSGGDDDRGLSHS